WCAALRVRVYASFDDQDVTAAAVEYTLRRVAHDELGEAAACDCAHYDDIRLTGAHQALQHFVRHSIDDDGRVRR
ncbi:MAG: hypothetical protein ABI640_21210, partial [Gammaproteobacteria bacterium]